MTERFTVPEIWQRFVDRVDARTGKPVAEFGLWAVAANHMTESELIAGRRILHAILELAEADPDGLAVPTHAWASQRSQDLKEGLWHYCRRNDCLNELGKRRQAEWRAEQALRIAREGAA